MKYENKNEEFGNVPDLFSGFQKFSYKFITFQ